MTLRDPQGAALRSAPLASPYAHPPLPARHRLWDCGSIFPRLLLIDLPTDRLAGRFVRDPGPHDHPSLPDSRHRRLGARADLQFAIDVAQMHLDGVVADEQLAGHLAVGQPLRHQAQDLHFSITEDVRWFF